MNKIISFVWLNSKSMYIRLHASFFVKALKCVSVDELDPYYGGLASKEILTNLVCQARSRHENYLANLS